MMYLSHEIVLSFVLRVILGVLFFFQGYDKIFNVKISGVISFFKEESRNKPFPSFLMAPSAYLTSYIEFIGGALLIIGLCKTWALYLLGFDLILVCGAFSILKPMWDMSYLFPRLILLAILLYIPAEWDVLTLDYLMK